MTISVQILEVSLQLRHSTVHIVTALIFHISHFFYHICTFSRDGSSSIHSPSYARASSCGTKVTQHLLPTRRQRKRYVMLPLTLTSSLTSLPPPKLQLSITYLNYPLACSFRVPRSINFAQKFTSVESCVQLNYP